MSIFSKFLGQVTTTVVDRVDHIPEADMPGCVAYVNHLLAPSGVAVTESTVRAIETMQAVYVMGRIVDQAVPQQLDPVKPLIDDVVSTALDTTAVSQLALDTSDVVSPSPDVSVSTGNPNATTGG